MRKQGIELQIYIFWGINIKTLIYIMLHSLYTKEICALKNGKSLMEMLGDIIGVTNRLIIDR